jgi:hypothetical protein
MHLYTLDKLKPVWKSQPVPKRQEGPVLLVVADTYEESIFKATDKDVIFYIYAPWFVGFIFL